MSRKMHADELLIDERLVKQLIANQFPKWLSSELKVVRPWGTDNAMFKLGDDKVVRLPRISSAADNLQKEIFSLLRLSNQLSLPIPQIISRGIPGESYPFIWTINTWLEGENPGENNKVEMEQAALDLAKFIADMQSVDSKGAHLSVRGKSLMTRDESTKKSIKLLDDIYDVQLLSNIWEESLSQSEWKNDPVWIHGDLHPGNILVKSGKISGVIDFGLSGIGDPACDMKVAWTFLDKGGRSKFRAAVQTDDATWARGRSWAFTMGVVAYPYYKETNPEFAKIAKRAIDEVIADYSCL